MEEEAVSGREIFLEEVLVEWKNMSYLETPLV
jgi:hypothetical protein